MLRRRWVLRMLLLVSLAYAGATAQAAGTSPAPTAGGASVYAALRQKLPEPPQGLMDAAQKLYQSDVLPMVRSDLVKRTPTGGSPRVSTVFPPYTGYQSATVVGPIPLLYYSDGFPLTKSSQVATTLVKVRNGWSTSSKAVTGDLAEYLTLHGSEILALTPEQPVSAAQTTPATQAALPMWMWLSAGFFAGAAVGLAAGWLLRARRRSAGS